jgi:predicted flap endonuclease-1-like 5' DNA nuclease
MTLKPQYYIDASKISTHQLKADLQNRELIPSRKPLKVDPEKNLLQLEKIGITTLQDLVTALKNKKQIPELSQNTGIGEDYLILLRREVYSYYPKPVPLSKFAGISTQEVEQLSIHGIKNSKQLFEYGASSESIDGLSTTTGIAAGELQRLRSMADLVRIFGVGPVFSGMLYDTGIRSLDDFLDHEPEEIIDLYQDSTGKKADFSVSDLKFSQRMAKYLITES